jgi:flagellar basal body rod protein FlgG
MMPSSLQLNKIEIYNTLGQLEGEKNTLDFSIADLAFGVHWLKISTSEGIIYKNFIKK